MCAPVFTLAVLTQSQKLVLHARQKGKRVETIPTEARKNNCPQYFVFLRNANLNFWLANA